MTLLRTTWALTTSAAMALMPHLAAQAQTTQGATAPVAPSSAIDYKHPLYDSGYGDRASAQLPLAIMYALEDDLTKQGLDEDHRALVINHAVDITMQAWSFFTSMMDLRYKQDKLSSELQPKAVNSMAIYDTFPKEKRWPFSIRVAQMVPAAAQQHSAPVLVCAEIPQLKMQSRGKLEAVGDRHVFLVGTLGLDGKFNKMSLTAPVEQQVNSETGIPTANACAPLINLYKAVLKECFERGLGANCPVSRFTEALPQ